MRGRELVLPEARPQRVGRDDEDDRVEGQEDQDGDVEVVPGADGGQEAAVATNTGPDFGPLESINQEDQQSHENRDSYADEKVYQESPIVLLVLELDWSADEGPEEIEAEDRHPAEHQDSGEVERIADQSARVAGYGQEILLP